MSAASDALSLTVYCGLCGEKPGQWCVTKTGKRASDLHGGRYWATQRIRILFWIEEEEAVARACSRIWKAKPDDRATLAYQGERSANKMIESLSERLEEMS